MQPKQPRWASKSLRSPVRRVGYLLLVCYIKPINIQRGLIQLLNVAGTYKVGIRRRKVNNKSADLLITKAYIVDNVVVIIVGS